MKLFTRLLAATVLSLPGISLAQEPSPRTIMAVDTSGSSTFLYDQSSADAAGNYVQGYITGLSHPHDLLMISLGDPGMGKRAIDIRASLTNRRASSADVLAGQFASFFRALPSLAARGQIKEQGTTSLVSFFQSLESVCAAGNATILVFTDGWEWSATIDGRAFGSGAATLPRPDGPFLSGCRIEMLGVGQVRSTGSSDGLEQLFSGQWRTFLEAAGADSVTVSGGFFGF